MSLIPKKGTVYVVDDDEAVRDSLDALLAGWGDDAALRRFLHGLPGVVRPLGHALTGAQLRADLPLHV